jgi:hypothetical protein
MQDRGHGNIFEVTHELLANMLGVRRVCITIAAVALRQACRESRCVLRVPNQGSGAVDMQAAEEPDLGKT